MTEAESADAEYFVCPHCGADVPASASFCRRCGASEDSGWNDEAPSTEDYEAGYADDDDFDYDEFISREFGERTTPRTSYGGTRGRMWAVVVIIGIALLVWTVLMTF